MAQYATRDNADYIEQLYQQFKSNPNSVSVEWRKFFEGVEFGAEGGFGLSEKELNVYNLIEAYRNYGHFEADLDPLTNTIPPSDQLSLKRFNLTDADLDNKFQIGEMVGKKNGTLREIIQHLRTAYCGKISVQCSEALPEVRNWFFREFENTTFKLSAAEKKSTFELLTKSETFEKFLHTRFVGAKRFSSEGADAVVPMMESLFQRCLPLGCEEVLVGMAHRGRLSILHNVMNRPVEALFTEFAGPMETEKPLEDFDGDVKYHLGHNTVRQTAAGPIQVSMACNPSHLETVDPIVLGMTRAAQRRRKDTKNRKKAIPVLIHGDAAFAGQGVVQECFQMAYVRGYTVGGTIHICIDNQVGFTANPENTRSSNYATDVAKILATPVLHVNGDDVEACVRTIDMAIRFRQEWGRDIVINLTCYRRYGHNEGDEPAYTQPLMYDIIRKHPTLRDIYSKQVVRENIIDGTTAETIVNAEMDRLQKLYELSKAKPSKIEVFKFEGNWKGLRKATAADFDKTWDTSFDLATLKKICTQIGEVPQGFTPHPKLIKLLEYRKTIAQGKEAMDWGTAELLAYGSLLHEGTSVRLTGQDCVRGTFTHRHAALYDSKTGEAYAALDQINGDKVEFCVYDSILSEYGVMGYEYGNAIMDPTFLTLWEAQFGDFANGAQIIIDQMLCSGEAKWQQMCGLVLLLPHGLEGQGPEHSSARLERFLQLSANYNWQVTNVSTPAQIYHALRRQIRRPFRKPLVNMSPKSLLRHPMAVSTIDELANGSFQEVLPDTYIKNPKNVESVLLCTGKIYFETHEERLKLKSERTALVRVEQLYPTPTKQIAAILKSYPNVKNLAWLQEEPKNHGAYQFMYFKLSEMLQKENIKLALHYVGRSERPSPAVGSLYRHKAEQAELIKNALSC